MARRVNLKLSVEFRPWMRVGCYLLAWACFIACIFSMRLADWLSDKGATVMARYGVRYVIDEAPVEPPLLLTYQPAP